MKDRHGVVRRVATAVGLLALINSFVTFSTSALAAMPDGPPLLPLPDVEVYVDEPDGSPLYHTRADIGRESILGATIVFPTNGLQGKGDVYFGLKDPDGLVYTWNTHIGVPQLEGNMTPLVSGIDLGTPRTYSLSEVFGEDMRYEFDGEEVRGLYLVFAVLVVAGSNPLDTRNWIVVDIAPLMVD